MRKYVFVSRTLTGPVTNVQAGDSSIPFDQANRDYQQFLLDWEAGVEVLSPDGSPAPYSDAAVRALGLEP